jgi:pseudouridine-5'-phosphate glycosidase
MEKHRFKWLGKKHDVQEKEAFKKDEHGEKLNKDSVAAAISTGESVWKTVFKVLLIAAIAGIVYLIYTYGF